MEDLNKKIGELNTSHYKMLLLIALVFQDKPFTVSNLMRIFRIQLKSALQLVKKFQNNGFIEKIGYVKTNNFGKKPTAYRLKKEVLDYVKLLIDQLREEYELIPIAISTPKQT